MRGWLWRRLGRGDARTDIDREIAFHLEMRAGEFEDDGLPRAEALLAASRSFGDVQAMADACLRERETRIRRIRRREIMHGIIDDAKVAARTLGRTPGFALAATLSLAAGIALTVATGALLDAYLVRALPYPDQDRLVSVYGPGAPDWRDAPAALEQVVAWDLDAFSIVSGANPERVWASWVTPSFFGTLGVRPQLGRFFGDDEAGPGGRPVAVISHGLWQRRWGGDPDVVGRTFSAYADDRPDEAEVFTIIGVLPADFWYFNRFTEVLAPLRGPRSVSLAVLVPGVTPLAAAALLERHARERDPGRDAEVHVVPAREPLVERVRPTLLAVGGAVALVLLIACGNAAVLFLVRATRREQEFAIRSAIGAGRARLARQLIVEGTLVAAMAAVLGIGGAGVLLHVVADAAPRVLGGAVPGGQAALRLDALSIGAGLASALVAALLFAVVPLVSAWNGDPARVLASGARSGGRPRQRLRAGLVVAELALSLSLLIGAGLLVRSAGHLQRLDLGFAPDDVAAIEISLRQGGGLDDAARVTLFDRIAQEVERQVPGVQAAIANTAPFGRTTMTELETDGGGSDEPAGAALIDAVAPGYFRTLGIRLLRGVAFDARHTAGTEPVAMVGASLASQLWPGQDPIGRRVRARVTDPSHADAPPPWRRVIGVVDDVRKTWTEENPPDLYVPMAQSPPVIVELVVRDPMGRARIGAIRDAIWTVNPELPLNEMRRLDDDIAIASLPSRFLAWLLSGFALFAIALATLGLYGVIAYAVSARRREIAIRMALGADASGVLRLFTRDAAKLIVLGSIGGIAGGIALGRVLGSQLHGISPLDPATWITLTLLLALIAFGATHIPSRRAARTEPMRILQRE